MCERQREAKGAKVCFFHLLSFFCFYSFCFFPFSTVRLRLHSSLPSMRTLSLSLFSPALSLTLSSPPHPSSLDAPFFPFRLSLRLRLAARVATSPENCPIFIIRHRQRDTRTNTQREKSSRSSEESTITSRGHTCTMMNHIELHRTRPFPTGALTKG